MAVDIVFSFYFRVSVSSWYYHGIKGLQLSKSCCLIVKWPYSPLTFSVSMLFSVYKAHCSLFFNNVNAPTRERFYMLSFEDQIDNVS